MYISTNYVDINIYPLTMECNAPLSMFIWKGRNIKWQYYYYYYYYCDKSEGEKSITEQISLNLIFAMTKCQQW